MNPATKQKVRIIKRKDAGTDTAVPAAEAPAASRQTAKEANRFAVATVSAWVREFQQQRREVSARQTFKNLFKEPAPQVA